MSTALAAAVAEAYEEPCNCTDAAPEAGSTNMVSERANTHTHTHTNKQTIPSEYHHDPTRFLKAMGERERERASEYERSDSQLRSSPQSTPTHTNLAACEHHVLPKYNTHWLFAKEKTLTNVALEGRSVEIGPSAEDFLAGRHDFRLNAEVLRWTYTHKHNTHTERKERNIKSQIPQARIQN